MLYILLGILWLTVINTHTMDLAERWRDVINAHDKKQAEDAQHVAQLVQAINERKKADHEQIARIIFNEPYPVCATRQQFEEVKILCKPDYEPVLAAGLKNRAIRAQMYYESAQKIPVNMLFEAMRCAKKSKKTSGEMRFASVVTLLKNGAANVEGATYEDEERERHGRDILRSQLPLVFAKYTPKLVKVLLQNGAQPKGQVVLSMIFAYKDVSGMLKEKLEKSLQHMLDHGANITQSYEWGMSFISPMELARQSKTSDLIKLFNEHLKKQSTK